ncbi:MAG: hypothetical protein IJH63_00205 [Methanobrevibacter sp.]|nr:hypothetical protein [Methanosphaera sp.]MBR0369125.1 hypothetical protein [Methanobrevibacter sp.]
MTITDLMEKEIETKKKLTSELQGKLDELTELELNIACEKNKILNDPLIGEKIEGRVTDKSKDAFVAKSLEKENNKKTWLQNDISKIKQDIGLCDDTIRLYKYVIREKELGV